MFERLEDRHLLAAYSFVVNSTGDASDLIVGDGICYTDTGECTLRAAIQEANFDSEADRIHFGGQIGGFRS